MNTTPPYVNDVSGLPHVLEDGGLGAWRSGQQAESVALPPEPSRAPLEIAPSEPMRLLTHLAEDGGLGALRSGQQDTAKNWLAEPVILQAAADVLRSSLPQEYLDPFAPVEVRRQAVANCLSGAIIEARQFNLPLGRVPTERDTFDQLFAATFGWGPAQRYLDDPHVNEIKIIGTSILVQEQGKPFVTVRERFSTELEVVSRAQLLASVLGVPLDASKPQVTLPLGHGTRMHVSIQPRTRNGPLVCIRRGRTTAWDLNDIVGRGSMDQATFEMLDLFCRARCSMLIVGRTGSGKTALLEALANSWSTESHIITIEDHTMEIGIKPEMSWTRELVDTHVDPLGFGLVAREALRQTPDLVLPGETRANEAGAILSLVLSDHPVITTIHARSGADGIERFASCAALPGSYMYEGRRNDALRDTASGFDVAIKVGFWAESGRRVITEIGLTNGVRETPGGLAAEVIPLVKLDIAEDGSLSWIAKARVVNGALQWIDGADQIPDRLREKLNSARIARYVHTLAPAQDIVSDALRRAEPLLASGQALRAIESLKDAWVQRHDGKLLQMAQRALVSLPHLWQENAAQTEAELAKLNTLLDRRQWDAARATLDAILTDLIRAAAFIPAGGWERYAQRIEAARQAARQARDLIANAHNELKSGRPRQVMAQLEQVNSMLLDPTTLLDLEDVRIAALEALVARGDAAHEALEAAKARHHSILHGQAATIFSTPVGGDA